MSYNVAIEDLEYNPWTEGIDLEPDFSEQIKFWREHFEEDGSEIEREEFEAYVSEHHPEFALTGGEVIWEHVPVKHVYHVQGNYGSGWTKLQGVFYNTESEAIETASRLARSNPHNGYRVVKKVVK